MCVCVCVCVSSYNVNSVESHIAIEIAAKVVQLMATDDELDHAAAAGSLAVHGSDGVSNFAGLCVVVSWASVAGVCCSHFRMMVTRLLRNSSHKQQEVCVCVCVCAFAVCSHWFAGNDKEKGEGSGTNGGGGPPPFGGGGFNWNGPRSRMAVKRVGGGGGGRRRRMLGGG